MNERIKKLRKTLDLTQQEFADKIGMKRNTIANYETDRNEPSNSVISLICRIFNVSETWLRFGEGEMFLQSNPEDELATAVNRILSGEPSAFKTRLLKILADLGPREWDILENYALKLVQDSPQQITQERAQAALPPREWTRADYHAQLDAQLDAEEERVAQASSVNASAAG